MMTARRSLIFAAFAVLALAIALFVANQGSETTQGDLVPLYPELKAQADSISALRIYKAGDTRAVEIVRKGDQWTLTERNGYPVASLQARNLIRSLANAAVLEEKTSDRAKYTALSVEDVTAPNANSVRLEIEGPSAPINLIVGKTGPDVKSSYVRRVGEVRSWLVNEHISAAAEPRDWLDKQIIDIAADRIQSATISREGAKPYTATKASRAAADFVVGPLPRGKSLTSPNAANSTATALTNLSLDDVLPKAEIAIDKPTDQATYTTFEGLVVHINGFKRDAKHYITLAATFDQALAEQFKVATSESTPQTRDEAVNTSKPDVATEAQTSTAKLSNWAYEIPDYKYSALFRPVDDLLKK
jgi:hypothetical protein